MQDQSMQRIAAPLAALLLAGTTMTGCPASAEGVTGQWEFSDNFSAAVGSPVIPNGTWDFTSPLIGQNGAQAASFTKNAYLTVPHGAAPNAGGNFVNRYTIIMDLYFPSFTDFVSLYQTNTSNANDADCYIRNDGGIGITSDYTEDSISLRFAAARWQRVAIVIDTTTPTSSAGDLNRTVYRIYIDGALQNVVQAPDGWGLDGRYSLDPTFLLFAEPNGFTAGGEINSLQFRDYAISPEEVALIGDAEARGVDNRTVSGTITLAECTKPEGTPLDLEFRPTIGKPFTRHITLAADGSFRLNGLPLRRYSVGIKGSRWLRKVVTDVNLLSGDAAGVTATLIPGDVNNDNSIDINDLGDLSDAFNTSKGGADFNANADLNCDDKVDITDLGILADNFNTAGDD